MACIVTLGICGTWLLGYLWAGLDASIVACRWFVRCGLGARNYAAGVRWSITGVREDAFKLAYNIVFS